jgi:lysophospholipase L1-like esterase
MKAALLLALASLPLLSRADLPMQPGERVVFLGDSITQAGTHVALIDAALIVHAPHEKYDIISVGLSSETVSGLSEPGHAGGQFPRPDLHERLDRVLAGTRPKHVLACYGMNCGVYMPLKEARFAAYRAGIQKLRDKVGGVGASMTHLTPPVHDPVPIMAKTDPNGAEGENFKLPYTRYNEVLDAYSDWLITQRSKGWSVTDLHGPMKKALEEGRAKDPTFVISKDGVHPGTDGHALMAQALLDAWGVPVKAADIATKPEYALLWKAVQAKHGVLRPAWLSKTGHKRPGVAPGLPLEEAQAKAAEHDAAARAACQK